MKKINLKKLTAFAATFALASQNGIFAVNANDQDCVGDDVFRKAIYDSLYDRDKDGVLSDEEAETMQSVVLDKNKFQEVTSFDFFGKLLNLEILELNNWENFNYGPIANVKQGKTIYSIRFISSNMKKTEEKFPGVRNITIEETENFDLEALSSFPDLKTLRIYNAPLKDVSPLKNLNIQKIELGDSVHNYNEFFSLIDYPDIVIPEGYIKMLNAKYWSVLHDRARLRVIDNSIAMPANRFFETYSKINIRDHPYILAVHSGETEYEVSNAKGTETGKITVVPDDPPDDPLVSEHLSKVRIIEPNIYCEYIYVLFENGDLYSFNKEGKGEFTKIDSNVADFFEYNHRYKSKGKNGIRHERHNDIWKTTPATLYKDGILKVGGKTIHDPKKYTVISSTNDFSYSLCSDGKIRTLKFENVFDYFAGDTTDTVIYKASEIKCNAKIKAINEDPNFHDVPVCQLEDGRTVLLKFEDNSETSAGIIDLGLNITPVHAIIKEHYKKYPDSVSGIDQDEYDYDDNLTIYYIVDIEKNLYQVDLKKDGSEPETKLIAKNVEKLDYIEDQNDHFGILKRHVAYLGNDNNYHDPEGKLKFEKSELYKLDYDFDYDFINPYCQVYSPAYGETEKGTVINEDSDFKGIELVSLNNSEGTEKFSCLGNFVSMTHVKDSIGAFFDGKDYCIIVLREDNTLWKYCVEANTFTRIDPNLKAPAPNKFSARDIVSLKRLLLGIDDNIDTSWMDINSDGVINGLDFIRIKKDILQNF